FLTFTKFVRFPTCKNPLVGDQIQAWTKGFPKLRTFVR
ncbi:hypothetical protein DBR06_SOUSAS20010010, partial [Sousa chinensis]